MFQKAQKCQSKLRLGIGGVSGAGKTWTALTLAERLAQGGRVAVLDTEHGSASLYADRFSFDVAGLSGDYHPDRYIEVINNAAREGYSVLVIDSLTHAWSGKNGVLDSVEACAKRMGRPDTFRAWGEVGTPLQNKLIDAILACPMHVIATFRMKQEYVIEKTDQGKSAPRKVGVGLQQRDGFEYELSIFGEMDLDHNLVIQKTRCAALDCKVYPKPGPEIADVLLDWLNSGAPEPDRDGLFDIPDNAPDNAKGNAKGNAPGNAPPPTPLPVATVDEKTKKAIGAFACWMTEAELVKRVGTPASEWGDDTIATLRKIYKKVKELPEGAQPNAAKQGIAAVFTPPTPEDEDEEPEVAPPKPGGPLRLSLQALALKYSEIGIYRADLDLVWKLPMDQWTPGIEKTATEALARLKAGETPEAVFGGWAPAGWRGVAA